MPEQRHFHRIRFAVKTEIECNGTLLEAFLVDISLKGVLVDCSGSITPVLGTHCHVKIHLTDSDVTISFEGKVVHMENGLAGIKITLIGIDSMIHLRRLVTLNSESPEQVRAELNALFGFDSEEEADSPAEAP